MDTIVHIEDGKYLGQTKFAPSLLEESLALGVREVRGVANLDHKKGIQIHRCKDSKDLIIDIGLVVLNGYAVPDVAYRVQEAVINSAAQLTTNKIDRVNVYVRGAKYGASVKQK